jgi:hypothetical protein
MAGAKKTEAGKHTVKPQVVIFLHLGKKWLYTTKSSLRLSKYALYVKQDESLSLEILG